MEEVLNLLGFLTHSELKQLQGILKVKLEKKAKKYGVKRNYKLTK
jgi:hypothetical protein